jgi:hypothetical protein
MEGKSKAALYYLSSVTCGSLFLLTGWIWAYGFCLFFSYPVAAVGIFLWSRGRKLNPGSRANPIALWLHVTGLSVSLIALLVLFFYN